MTTQQQVIEQAAARMSGPQTEPNVFDEVVWAFAAEQGAQAEARAAQGRLVAAQLRLRKAVAAAEAAL